MGLSTVRNLHETSLRCRKSVVDHFTDLLISALDYLRISYGNRALRQYSHFLTPLC